VYAKDGKSYLARVDGVDEGSETYRVTFLEYGQTASVPFEQVSIWRSASGEQLRRMPNAPVKALWPEDGLFYAASLDGPSSAELPGHYVVRFGAAVGLAGKKKKKVDVLLHDIVLNEKFIDPRSLQLTSAASASAKASAAAAAAPLSEELVVPPHLEPNPSDSDAVRQSKAKKLKKMRYEHKVAWEAAQTDKRKNSWLDFKAGKTASGAVKKAKLSTAPGLVQLQKKQSMFSTPDSIEGRVGVVGSGNAMTEHAALKRHVFDKSDAPM
jgi:hypothetical protein